MRASLTVRGAPLRQPWIEAAGRDVHRTIPAAAPALLQAWLAFYRANRAKIRKDSGALRAFYTAGKDRSRQVEVTPLGWQVTSTLPQVRFYPGPPIPGQLLSGVLVDYLPSPSRFGGLP